MKAMNITRNPAGGRGNTSLPGILMASLSCGIKPRSRILRRSPSRVFVRRLPPSVTRVAALPFLPLAAALVDVFFDFTIAARQRRRREHMKEEGYDRRISSVRREK